MLLQEGNLEPDILSIYEINVLPVITVGFEQNFIHTFFYIKETFPQGRKK